MTELQYDLHNHSTFSDGWDCEEMAEAAVESGLSGIGFTDHCIVWDDAFDISDRFDLDETYRRRRRQIDDIRERVDVEIFDAVELDYDPRREDAIREFIESADFDYVIGSVHCTDEWYYSNPSHPDGDIDLATASERTKRDAIETYVDWQVSLVESELYDVLGHLDLPQRSPSLRGLFTEADYRRLADALSNSRTVPEINAGRLDREYGDVHPDPQYHDVFVERDVEFVIGTDSHAPDQLRRRNKLLDSTLPELDLQLVDRPVCLP